MSKVINPAAELEVLAKTILVNLEKSDNMYVSAGQNMKRAKELCKEQGIKWGDWLKANGIGTSKAAICLAIADGRKTVDEVRKDAAERQKKHKDTLKKKASKADPVEDSDEGDEGDEGMTAEHKAMIKAIAKFIQVAPPATLAKMCKAFKITI
jgi:hypothetical protein